MPLRAVAALLLWASCYDPSVKLGVPCSAAGDCPRGQQCDDLTQICMAPTELVTWRDDTAEDFAQPGAVLANGVVEAAGFVAPTPYLTSRVRLSAIASDTIGDVATATWATASTGTITGRAFSTDLSIDYSDEIPPGLGLASGDNVTVLIEGELYLDAMGLWRLSLRANDKGFIELAAPGGDYERITDDTNVGSIVSYMASTVGWYRFRAAFADVAQLMSFELEVDSPVLQGMFRNVDTENLRVAVDDLQGYLVDAFNEPALLAYVATAHDTQPLVDRPLAADPFGFEIGTLGWSLRWSNQVLIETEGDYAFRIVSFHGHRMWIDGMEVANNFATSATTTSTTAPIHLVAGWHDVVTDVTKEDDTTPGQLSVTVESGPVWAGQPIPIDHIRPVMGRSKRWLGGSSTAVLAIPDGATAARSVFLQPPFGFVPELIEAGYVIEHPVPAQVSIVLDPPVGANITLLAAGSATGTGLYNDHTTVSVASYGTSWIFVAGDNTVDAMTGNLTGAAVTVVGRGGVAPFPTAVRYESAVRALGNVVGYGAASWQLRQGSTATVQMRSCDDAAACASEPWTDVVNGSVPAVTARPFSQYAVAITTDGDVPTALDWFELIYSARPD